MKPTLNSQATATDDARRDYLTQQYNTRANAALAESTLARWTASAALTRRRQACVLDLPCGESAAERVDYFPCAKRNAPLLIFIHGGWWRLLDKRDFSWVAESFTEAGFNVALTNYDLCPRVSLTTIVEQTLRAVAYLYSQSETLDFDPQQIHIAGHSAGGHLAAMMAAADWSAYQAGMPKQLFKTGQLISGLFDLEPLTQMPAVQADLRLSATELHTCSPLSYAAPSSVLRAWAGGAESDEFARQSALICSHWGKQGADISGMPNAGLTHFTVMDAWCDPEHALHQAALALMRA